ncbi:MAG: MFS transporter [Actinobacteria bacterium]|nr:MAG: MFS transporter [Actinomycetota bacterium]
MSRRRLSGAGLGLALAFFVTLGMTDGSLGAAWPSLRDEFDRSLSQLGLLLATGSIGYLVASSGFGAIHKRLETHGAIVLGGAAMAVGLAGIAVAPSWLVIVIAAVLLGAGGGLVDTGINAHASLEFDVGSTNLLHSAFGLGAAIGPILIAASLTAGQTWRGGYAIIAMTQLVVLIFVLRSRPRLASQDAASAETGTSALSNPRTQTLTLVMFLLYTGSEVAVGQWSFTLLTEARGLSVGAAGAWVAAYWGGLTLGRAVFAGVGPRIAPTRIIKVSITTATVGVAMLWLDAGGLGFVGLPIAGLGFAAIFPTMVSLTPHRIGRDRSPAMMGYQLAAANLGAATVPWAVGLVAESAGLTTLSPALLVSVLLLGLLHLALERKT